MLYYSAQIVAALVFGWLMDLKRFRRITKAWAGLALVAVLVFVTNGCAVYYQKDYTRTDASSASWVRLDLDDGTNYARHLILYIFFGVTDAIWQNWIYWVMGALSNDSAHLAHLVGFYKSVQSAGSAGVFRLDANKTLYMVELAVTWALCGFAILCIIPAVYLHVKDHTEEAVVFAEPVEGDKAEVASVGSEDKKAPAQVLEA
jgi:hypothetical protein